MLPGRTITITVTGRTVTPPPAQVDLPVGETLTLVVSSDHEDDLHALGFEVEVPLKAGVPTAEGNARIAAVAREAWRRRR